MKTSVEMTQQIMSSRHAGVCKLTNIVWMLWFRKFCLYHWNSKHRTKTAHSWELLWDAVERKSEWIVPEEGINDLEKQFTNCFSASKMTGPERTEIEMLIIVVSCRLSQSACLSSFQPQTEKTSWQNWSLIRCRTPRCDERWTRDEHWSCSCSRSRASFLQVR